MTLGCGTYRVLIHPRDTLTRAVLEVPWRSVTYSRVLDETSAARVQAGAGCCEALRAVAVRPWSHTLAIYRTGGGGDAVRVWSGPVTALEDGEGVTFDARDLSAWFERRRVHSDQLHFTTDLSTIYEAFWLDAMAPDPVPDFTLQITPAGRDADREVLADQNRMVGDELRELGRTGLDWTVIDRVHLVGPEEIETPPIATLIGEHFAEPPTISMDGLDQVNDWVVSGTGGGAEGDEVVGVANTPFGPEGLLEGVASESSILDASSADDNAATRLARTSVPQTFIREGQLVAKAPVAFTDLIPGARVRVALGDRCLPVLQEQRLQSVNVAVSAGDRGVVEQVTIALQPLGSTTD